MKRIAIAIAKATATLLTFLIVQNAIGQTGKVGRGVKANQPKTNKEVVKLKAEVNLQKSKWGGGKMLTGKLELPTLHPSTAYELTLDIQNNSDTTVEFDKADTSSPSRKIVFEKGFFPARGSTEAVIFFTTPQSINGKSYSASVEFRYKRDKVCGLVIRGVLAENLHLSWPAKTIDLDKGDSKAEVPFLFSSPITLDSLSVEKSKKLETYLDAEIIADEKDPNQGILLLRSLDSKQVKETIIGSVLLSHKHTGKSQRLTVHLQRDTDISIHPRYLDFVQREKGSKVLTANLLIRLSRNTTSKKENEKRKSPSVSAKLDSGKFHGLMKVKKLSNRIFRVSVSFSKDDLNAMTKTQQQLEWNIRIGGHQLKVSTPFSF